MQFYGFMQGKSLSLSWVIKKRFESHIFFNLLSHITLVEVCSNLEQLFSKLILDMYDLIELLQVV